MKEIREKRRLQHIQEKEEYAKYINDREVPKAEFKEWAKIPRLNGEIFTITEKLDGTNGQIYIHEDGQIDVGSRSRWCNASKLDDHFGFYKWIQERKQEIFDVLGPGRYYGEFIGSGIERKYGFSNGEKRFYLFNITLEEKVAPLNILGIYTVPDLTRDVIDFIHFQHLTQHIEFSLASLRKLGSRINDYPYPEGIIIRPFLVSSHKNVFWKDYVYEKVPKGVHSR
jgi:hypothetical protein